VPQLDEVVRLAVALLQLPLGVLEVPAGADGVDRGERRLVDLEERALLQRAHHGRAAGFALDREVLDLEAALGREPNLAASLLWAWAEHGQTYR
jgi:hypothetical protein